MKISEILLLLFATLCFIAALSYGVYTTIKVDQLAEQTFYDLQRTHKKFDILADNMQTKYQEITSKIEKKRPGK